MLKMACIQERGKFECRKIHVSFVKESARAVCVTLGGRGFRSSGGK